MSSTLRIKGNYHSPGREMAQGERTRKNHGEESETSATNSNGEKHLSKDLDEDNGKRILIVVPEDADISEVVQMSDVTRRAGLKVLIASLDDSENVRSSSDVICRVDLSLSNALLEAPFEALVLPGGLLGAKALGESMKVRTLLEEYEKNRRWIVAIGDATPVLRKHFIGAGKTLTCHPLVKHKIEGSDYMKYKYVDDDVFVDGKIITCRGGPHTLQCALNLIHLISGREIAENIASELMIEYDDGYCGDCCGNCKYCCREDKKKIEPDIAERFACSNCCSADDEDVSHWEEDKRFAEIMETENMISYKLRREELKDEENDKRKEKEELDEQTREDKKELEKWRKKWASGGCVSQEQYDKYIREYAERDEACYLARMKKIHERLYARIERSKRRREMVDFLRDVDPSEIDAAFAHIN